MSPIASWGRASSCAMGGFCRRQAMAASRRDDDVVEGELAPPATMIEHETAAIEEPEPAVVEAIEPDPPPPLRSPPPSVTSASGSTPGFAIASSPIRSPPVCSVVSRSSRGRIGRKFRTARRERAFIGPVTPNGVLSGKRRRGRRWGSRAEPSRAKGRDVCAGTLSTMVARGKLIDHEASPAPSNKV